MMMMVMVGMMMIDDDDDDDCHGNDEGDCSTGLWGDGSRDLSSGVHHHNHH